MDKFPPVMESLAAVLDLIRSDTAVARSEIQRVSGFGRGLISERVNQLLKAGIVVEGDFSPSTGGRAARELRLNVAAGVILTCYANLTDFDLGVADLSGRLLVTYHEHCDFDAGPSEMVTRAKVLWREMLSELDVGHRKVRGIGFGIPAHIDFENGKLIDSPSLPAIWTRYDLRRDISSFFSAPVWIDTLENLLVIGELRVGAAQRQLNVVYLFVDMAVGMGLVIDGHLYRGSQGAAGNIGHITWGGDALCRCGHRGCVEAVAGGEALLRQATAIGKRSPHSYFGTVLGAGHSITLNHLSEGLRRGDPDTTDIVAKAGEVLGCALASTITIVNPALVLVGGRLTQMGDVFLTALENALLRHSLPFVTQELRIVPVLHSEYAGLTGAAHMVIDQLFSPNGLADWMCSP